jgi:hypothetical protein
MGGDKFIGLQVFGLQVFGFLRIAGEVPLSAGAA